MNKKKLTGGASAFLTEDLAQELRKIAERVYGNLAVSVSSEIQDGFRFLLVTVSTTEMASVVEVTRLLEMLEAEFSRRVPSRVDDYSWMINIKRGEEILRSISGGWEARPAS